jgi:addiction module HigA family antidote
MSMLISGSVKAAMPTRNPPHPGDLIRTEIIEALGLTVSKAAEILKVRRATLSDLLDGKAALTPEMAVRIEKAFGPDRTTFSACSLLTTWPKHGNTRATSASSGTSRPESRVRALI